MDALRKLTFERFELDLLEAELRMDGRPVQVEPQVFDLLWYFANNPGKLISKDDLIKGVWGGRIVSDAAITTRINGARVAIGDSGNEQRLIRTVHRRGYRFLADVRSQNRVPADGGGGPDQPKRSEALESNGKPAIAVMPIQAMDGNEDTHALAEGMRIDIQNALIKVSGLFLTAVGSINAAKGMDLLDAAQALNARYLLTGQLRRLQDTLRLSVQLLDAKTNRFILSDHFDHRFEDTFKVLDEVTAEVLETLNIALVAGEPARVWHKTLKDIDSLSIFYRGISNFFKMNPEALSVSRVDFERIAILHPDLAIGHTWVALTHWFDLQRGWSGDREASKTNARSSAEKAVTLPDTDGQAHTVLSHVYLIEEKFPDALLAGKNAVANRPSCTNANAFYANVLHYCGQDSEALRHIRLALHQSPFSPPFFKLILIKALIALGQLDEAEERLAALLDAQSQDLPAYFLACLLALRRERLELVSIHAQQITKLEPSFSVHSYLSGEPYRDKEAKRALAAELTNAGLPN